MLRQVRGGPGSSGCPEIELDMKELAPWLKLEELKK